MIRALKKTDPDIVYRGVCKVLKKMTPAQLDSIKEEIWVMQMELDDAKEEYKDS